MAGHSKFKNIQHRKGAQDAKRAKLFARLVKEISIAARDGDNPDFNPKLRAALNQARNNNVPKDNITRAVQKAKDSAALEEITYAGYGMDGVAVVVDTTTDNLRRTASSVRTAFSKMGCAMAERDAVLFQFDRMAFLDVPVTTLDEEQAMACAETLGACDLIADEELWRFLFAMEEYSRVNERSEDALDGKMEGVVVGLLWNPKTRVPVSDEGQEKLAKLISLLEDIDCVDDVYTNAE